MTVISNLGKIWQKNAEDQKSNKLLEYENNNDKRVIQNMALTAKKTDIRFASEDRDQYDSLMKNTAYEHTIFTSYTDIPDMKPIPKTLQNLQV